MHSIPVTQNQRHELLKHFPELWNILLNKPMDLIDYNNLMDYAHTPQPKDWQTRKFNRLIVDLGKTCSTQ